MFSFDSLLLKNADTCARQHEFQKPTAYSSNWSFVRKFNKGIASTVNVKSKLNVTCVGGISINM